MTKPLKFSLLLIAAFALSSCGWFAGVSITGVALSEGTLTPDFDVTVTQYTATVPNATASIDVTVESDNPDLAVTINETSVLPGTGTATIALVVGENTVTIVVSDGEESVTYTVVVTRLPAPEINVIGKANYFDEGESVLESGATVDFETDWWNRTMTFTIQNTGTAPLTLTGTSPNYVTIVNADDPGYFSVSVQPTTDTIAPGEQETFSVLFEYVTYSTVPRTGTVTILNDGGNESTFTLSLTGVMNC